MKISSLTEVSTPLAGERLRPLGHVSTDAYSQANVGDTRQKSQFLKFSRLGRKPLVTAQR